VAGCDPHEYRSYTLHRGVNRAVYLVAQGLLQPVFHVCFRMRRLGREHAPRTGPVIVAANDRSFPDPFIVGTLVRRPVYDVARTELFAHPVAGRRLNLSERSRSTVVPATSRRWRLRAGSSSGVTAW